MSRHYYDPQDRLLIDSVQVNIWQYYLLPVLMMIRHPIGIEEWFLQIKSTIKEDGIKTTTYYLKKVKYEL